MNWLVATQPKSTPADVAEVRIFVVKAETEGEAYGKLKQQQPGQMIRGLIALNEMAYFRKLYESDDK